MSTLGQPIIFDGNASDDAMFQTKKDELYWVATPQGWFVHRPMVIGQAYIRHTPTHLPEFPYKNGIIFYDFPLLPKELMSQAIDFFKRIYERDHSEAEVIIVYNETANPKVKLFVPPQKCSGGSVNSAFNPEHVQPGWQMIGSIHSHCNFSAFHSGTDTGDAAEFDGLHITIGDILKDTPSFAAMVMINKSKVDYKIEQIADVSDLKADTAPKHWDRFVLTTTNTNTKIEATWEQFKATPRTEVKRYEPQHRNSRTPMWQRHDWHQAQPVKNVTPILGPNGKPLSKRERKRLAKLAKQQQPQGSENYWADQLPWRQGDSQGIGRPQTWECDQCFCRVVNHRMWDKNYCPQCHHMFGAIDPDTEYRDMKEIEKAAKDEITDEEWDSYFETKYDITRPKRNPDIPHDMIAKEIIDEFYEMFAEISELGIYASDLIPAEDLLSAEDLTRLKSGAGNPAPAKTTTPPVAEGQVTIDDILTVN